MVMQTVIIMLPVSMMLQSLGAVCVYGDETCVSDGHAICVYGARALVVQSVSLMCSL